MSKRSKALELAIQSMAGGGWGDRFSEEVLARAEVFRDYLDDEIEFVAEAHEWAEYRYFLDESYKGQTFVYRANGREVGYRRLGHDGEWNVSEAYLSIEELEADTEFISEVSDETGYRYYRSDDHFGLTYRIRDGVAECRYLDLPRDKWDPSVMSGDELLASPKVKEVRI
jgi:hypothetical protein